MANALIFGSAVGAVLGLIHAWYIYLRRVGESPRDLAEHPLAVRANAAYFALWAFSLWLLFGAYVLYLWLLSVIVYVLYAASKRIPNIMGFR